MKIAIASDHAGYGAKEIEHGEGSDSLVHCFIKQMNQ